ncbi:MAG: hypothetical protein Hyperionvirus2_33 [Hyperionvirus sp.]|uniref:Methyltransferase n=1 Tax=Hyperionvirus sp. TaxID=2487770 RepID=A0A3G5A5Y8_9VIRU|nr:MAG: hypothetical protein Hyperionvirus2_33 [Hyperionvirus sp.]
MAAAAAPPKSLCADDMQRLYLMVLGYYRFKMNSLMRYDGDSRIELMKSKLQGILENFYNCPTSHVINMIVFIDEACKIIDGYAVRIAFESAGINAKLPLEMDREKGKIPFFDAILGAMHEQKVKAVVDFGSGTGFLSYCLGRYAGEQKKSLSVYAIDLKRCDKNCMVEQEIGTVDKLRKHEDSLLFLVWRPYKLFKPYDAIRVFPGNLILFNDEGYMYDDRALEEFRKNWTRVPTLIEYSRPKYAGYELYKRDHIVPAAAAAP